MTLRRPSCHRRPIAQCNCFAFRCPLRRWHFPSPLGRHWEYHTLSWRRQEYDALSMRWEYHTLSTARWEYDALSMRARSRADTERVSYSQQAALAENIIFFVTNWFYFSFLHYPNLIALKQSNRAPTTPLAGCASYLASPPLSLRVFGWLLCFFPLFGDCRRIPLHRRGCCRPCRTHPNLIAPKTIKYSSLCAPHRLHIPPLPRLNLFGLVFYLIVDWRPP